MQNTRCYCEAPASKLRSRSNEMFEHDAAAPPVQRTPAPAAALAGSFTTPARLHGTIPGTHKDKAGLAGGLDANSVLGIATVGIDKLHSSVGGHDGGA